jgi:phosphatidylethanolamine/phosphatidyl-N-methylethanolamine N-methyltransferase
VAVKFLDDILKRLRLRVGGDGAGVAVLDDARVIKAYARWAPVYDAVFGVITAMAQRAAMAVLNRLPAGRILEVGVGTGITLPRYKTEHRVSGVDLSPDMLQRARARVRREALPNIDRLQVMDAARLAFDDGSFDAGVAMFVMTVVPDPQRVLSQLIRVVKPGGRVILLNHFSADSGIRARAERWLSQFAGALGWNADFPMEKVMGRPELRLVAKHRLPPFGLYTLLVFDRC